ncbi:MAG TPA: hypothetical protein PLD81_08150 [Elusimicrobiales bacterium]|nr:hypothetical protein [Elusimicrobiales bacterium]
MSIVLSTCAIIITVIIILVGLELIDTLKKIKAASEAVEKLSKDIDDRVMDVEPAFKMVNGVSSQINNLVSNLINSIPYNIAHNYIGGKGINNLVSMVSNLINSIPYIAHIFKKQ